MTGLAALGSVTGCRTRMVRAAEEPAPSAPPKWIDGSPHLTESAEIEGLHLTYLDWGGVGPTVVLVHGLGGNPHIFDDLAPLLREHHHVLAYARRGHGDSDAPARGPYDLRAMVSDLRGFLDRLRIDRADLVAWSTGGDEVTRFAAVAPERVDKLVYLDAGYDFSDPRFLEAYGKIVADTKAADDDYASLDAYRAWFQDVWLGAHQTWTPGLEAFLRDRVGVGDDGRVTPRTPKGVAKQLFASLEDAPRDYTRVTAPALALYATSFFPTDSANADRAALTRAFERRVGAPFREANMARVRRELRGATVREVPGTTHVSIGVSGVESLAATIEDFLAETVAAAAPDGGEDRPRDAAPPPFRQSEQSERAGAP
ncbi:MAG TPA: alpha/beta hydrolase [Polyangia bacterium]|nr:alpha/beta hydrolase [Polyangia bacterium]